MLLSVSLIVIIPSDNGFGNVIKNKSAEKLQRVFVDFRKKRQAFTIICLESTGFYQHSGTFP